MKSGFVYIALFLVAASVLTQCVEPYPPPVTDNAANYLVVNGFLNSTDGSISVRITRTIPLTTTSRPPVETGATVTLEDEAGTTLPVFETTDGNYVTTGLPIDPTRRYRLRIKTQTDQECVSAFVAMKNTPPIDSITWDTNGDGVRILVNAHDDTDQTLYYKWDFVETWQYNAAYFSYFKFASPATNEVVLREEDELIYTCWKSHPSQQILINSSERLSRDVVSKFPLTFIEKGSQRLMIRYSILVKQYALTRDAYDYWEAVKKTTESLGGLFDPQPGQILGNFQNLSNPNEPVVGFFNGGQVQEKRFFLGYNELPDDYKFSPTNWDCMADTVMVAELGNLSRESHLLVSSVYRGPVLLGYTYTPVPCADCRNSGGSTTKPSFWP